MKPALFANCVAMALSVVAPAVSGTACAATDFALPLLPVLSSSDFEACQKDSGVTISLLGPIPGTADLAVIDKTASCGKLFTAVQSAVASANLTCTVLDKSASSFVGTSLSTFLANVAELTNGNPTTVAPTTTTTPSSVKPNAASLPGHSIVIATIALAVCAF
ncbi:hypothetical protein ACHHYP_02460 [Achlya hypogyna]|uniref:Secreted protein n=1 Tax=Achlya hypogyna TaxID=1202772 RepID=A0A0A7CMX3_ACHHY|nr:secreted protein [Achlya hypogyna]OQR93544.1 hypothetical protein ACHHYP_02460 [Achlya hypogyna]